jgi:hypothetical protein
MSVSCQSLAAVVVSLLIGGCVSVKQQADMCGFTKLRGEEVTLSRITLREHPSAPVLYLATESDFILMQPSDVVRYLTEHRVRGDFGQLLKAIEKDLPLMRNTDILNYSLENTSLFHATKQVVVGVIELGNASIIHVSSNEALKEVVVLKIDGHGKFRIVCDPPDRGLLEVTDAVE